MITAACTEVLQGSKPDTNFRAPPHYLVKTRIAIKWISPPPPPPPQTTLLHSAPTTVFTALPIQLQDVTLEGTKEPTFPLPWNLLGPWEEYPSSSSTVGSSSEIIIYIYMHTCISIIRWACLQTLPPVCSSTVALPSCVQYSWFTSFFPSGSWCLAAYLWVWIFFFSLFSRFFLLLFSPFFFHEFVFFFIFLFLFCFSSDTFCF